MEMLWTILAVFIAGLVLGFTPMYFYNRSRFKVLMVLQNERNTFKEELSSINSQSEFLSRTLSETKKELDMVRRERNEKAEGLARLETERRTLLESIERHKSDIESMQDKFSKDFQLLANRIFEEKSEKFALQNKNSLDGILSPLKERIIEFQKKVEDTHSWSISENASLKQELKQLKEMSERMSNEAENLSKALKNDSKAQGNWGEMILENILQSSGLKKDREFFLQQSFTNEEGRRLQPDVMIKLPDEKWVVIDSKVSLKAYEQYASEEDADLSAAHLKAHLLSLKNHIKSLAGKKYNDLGHGNNLDFILMFVPIEPAYLVALHSDQTLFNEAYEKQIVMVSPSTLIASLKIIASTWKHEYQNRNALEIAKRGKLLLEKFIGFTEDFAKIGDQLSRTDKVYNEALKKLRDGRGSLVDQAQKLEELGIKSEKQIGEAFTAAD